MTGFSRFGKRWATTGAVMDPSDAQADAGFAFLGATPPSVEMFNAVLQDLDDKDNTLFAWIAAVLTAAEITPADASPGQLLAALNLLIAQSVPAVRIRLAANLNLYVATTGSDGNNGLTLGTPFGTLQKAWDVIHNSYDLNGHTVTVNVAYGTYGAGVAAGGPVPGASGLASVVFSGNAGSPASVVVSTGAANCFSASSGAAFTVSGMQLQGSGNNCLLTSSGGSIAYSNLVFGAVGPSGVHVTNLGGVITATGNYSISGGAAGHIVSQGSGATTSFAAGSTVTLTGTPAFASGFVQAGLGGLLSALNVTFTGPATGARYLVSNNAVISTGSGNPTYFPGSSPGMATLGGQYS